MARSVGSGERPVVLSIEELSKSYPAPWTPWRRGKGDRSHPALERVSLEVREGEIVGLLGPNGAGKTTLLKTVATLLHPSSGSIRIDGHEIFEHPARTRGMIGLITCDERSFYWRLSGRRNLRFFSALYGLTREEGEARAEELLQTLGLLHAADRPFHTYSSGMKQKLAIARGLLSRPRILLYDEPTRSLDPVSARNIHEWIMKERLKLPTQTHLIATNRLDEAETLCDRVVIINRGAIIAEGSVQEIHDRWRKRAYQLNRIRYRGRLSPEEIRRDSDTSLLEVEEESTDGEESVLRVRTVTGSDALSRVLRSILDSGGIVLDCIPEQIRFDDVFCALVLGETEDPREAGGPS